MQTFREFLQEQEQQVRAEEERENQRVARWSRFVEELADQITDWLREDDTRNLLKIERRIIDVDGGLAGIHRLTSLKIRLGSRTVDFDPLAGPVMGPMTRPKMTNWLGRVDLIGSYCTYNLYCKADDDDKASWVALNDSNFRATPFTREFFDVAMRELFS
jgi:hypothetical protein